MPAAKLSATDPRIEAAKAAERKIQLIARTRRPTDAESAEALAAYAAAAEATAERTLAALAIWDEYV